MKVWLARVDHHFSQLLLVWGSVAVGMAGLHVYELGDTPGLWSWLVAQATVGLLGAPLWVGLAWPLVSLSSPRARSWGLGALALTILLCEAALVHYQQIAGVPLGADLLAYSFAEIVTTVAGASSKVSWSEAAALIAGVALMGVAVRAQMHWAQSPPESSRRSRGLHIGLVLLCGAVALFLPTPSASRNKLSFFIGDVIDKTLGQGPAGSVVGQMYADYPFARLERTPDTLGPLLHLKEGAPPHLLFIIVEGLGRDFSGPGARLGSFTPFLDELAQRSLYWENFLAPQGRTFAVLHSVFGSLPFGPYGARPVAHDSLLSLLKSHGYELRYLTGSNLEFDQQGAYLSGQGVSDQFSERDYQKPERRLTEWGYSDEDLLAAVAARWSQPALGPTVTIAQTMTMHSPFMFPGIEAYRKRVDAHLDSLQIAPNRRDAYLRQRDIYASILYTDDMLRRLFEALARSPEGANTLVVITGDHRMPDIPMDTRLERYHVPLIVASPLLHSPVRVKAVSSHFDVAPSLLAMLSNKYGWATPRVVSWMGQGLDTSVEFRNVHALPLQQTKTELSDYISGAMYLGQDRMYALSDGMIQAPVDQPEVLQKLRQDFEAFKAGKAWVLKADRMTPESTAGQLNPFVPTQRTLESQSQLTQLQGVVVSKTKVVWTGHEQVMARAVFTQHGKEASVKFVPLLVLTDPQGQELGEAYGQAIQLKAGESREVSLTLTPRASSLPSYFAAMVVSHPDTGKPVGQGQYRVAVQR